MDCPKRTTSKKTTVGLYKGYLPSLKKFLIFFPKKLTLKKFLILSQKKVFLIFWEMELSNPKIKRFLIFSPKKVFLIFWEMKIFKKLLYFRRELSELEIKKKHSEKIYISGNGSFPKLK